MRHYLVFLLNSVVMFLKSIFLTSFLNKLLILLSLTLIVAPSAFSKTKDVGVCFLKAQTQKNFQTLINEISMSPQDNIRIQQSARYFNDLTSLDVPIDTFNYKIFWIKRPNNDWLTQNCFKFGYISVMDYNRRAITRVYSTPSKDDEPEAAPRMPASAVPKPDPINTNLQTEDSNRFNPPQSAQPQQIPQIHLYNYYGSQPGTDPNGRKAANTENSNEENLNVNVNVGDKKEVEAKKVSQEPAKTKQCSPYDLPSYLDDPSYFFELIPFMAYENTRVSGSGEINKFNMFMYGADIKFGYRFNPHFNYYFKGRYASLDLRSVDAPTFVALNEKSDISYGLGIEHKASRFLSLALEYNALHMQSFEQLAIPVDIDSVREDFQTLNLDFKLSFISRDDFQFGLATNYGIVIADNSDELIYDFRTKLYTLRTFEKGHFGLNLGFEQNRFNYINGNTDSVNRRRYFFGLNYGFDL